MTYKIQQDLFTHTTIHCKNCGDELEFMGHWYEEGVPMCSYKCADCNVATDIETKYPIIKRQERVLFTHEELKIIRMALTCGEMEYVGLNILSLDMMLHKINQMRIQLESKPL